jgi:WD40-like Beta Propeller Repeat
VTRLGGKPRRLTYRGGSSPSWSPHGTKLAFVRARSRRGVVRRDIYVVRRDGRGLGRLTRRGGDSPSWSPDGRWIAFNPRWRRLRGSQQRRRPPPPGERATARPRGPDRDLTGLAASAARPARPKPTRTRVPKSFTGTARGHAPSAYDRERERKSRPTTPDELHERTAAVLLLDERGADASGLPFHKGEATREPITPSLTTGPRPQRGPAVRQRMCLQPSLAEAEVADHVLGVSFRAGRPASRAVHCSAPLPRGGDAAHRRHTLGPGVL